MKGQNISFAKNNYPHLKGFRLADVNLGCTNFAKDILIGVDYYYEFFSGKILKGNEGPVASESICGWVLSGMLGDRNVYNSPTHTIKCSVESTDVLREDLKVLGN